MIIFDNNAQDRVCGNSGVLDVNNHHVANRDMTGVDFGLCESRITMHMENSLRVC